jgi:hypothetical protein
MLVAHVGVFYNSDTVLYHIKQFKQGINSELYHNVDAFVDCTAPVRIAILHIPYPVDPEFVSLVRRLQSWCSAVFVICTELHPGTVAQIQQCDYSNTLYYVAGTLNFNMAFSPVHECQDWFHTTSYFYQQYLPELLTRLQPYSVKPRSFDALLGRKKPHRDHVYNLITASGLPSVTTYINKTQTEFNSDPAQWRWELPGVKMHGIPAWTVDRVDYYGHNMSISQIIPIEVYNETAFSLVTETCYSNDFSFYTEKTCKPILSRRLFVVFAGQYHLRNLRRMGFLTFGDIIDESYDQEPDPEYRWNQAFDQVRLLCGMDQLTMLSKTQHITNHNYQVMTQNNWYNRFSQQLEQDIARTIAD